MLKELHISNYRLFDELHIPDLGQVNLIAGKNNTGKTALLEALRIWAAGANSSVVNHILKARNQFTPDFEESYYALFNRTKNDSELKINELLIKREQRSPGQGRAFRVARERKNTMQGLPTLNANITPDFPQDQSIFVPFNNHFPLQGLWEKIVLTPSYIFYA